MIYEEIIDRLQANGCKITPQRKNIIKIFIKAKRHLSAMEIYERLHNRETRISLDTVYRNLAVLKDLQIINQLDFQDGRSYYELNRTNGHHHHLVCLKCGGTWKIAGCPLEHHNINGIPANFEVTTHRFEMFGYCGDCRE